MAGTTVYTSTTVGFPHGGQRTNVKLFEAEQALKDGAQELDAVINISKTKGGDWEYIEEELRNLTNLTHTAGARRSTNKTRSARTVRE